MALILSGDEEQFRDSVRRFVAERSPLAKLRELMSSGQPFDADVWKQLSAARAARPDHPGGARRRGGGLLGAFRRPRRARRGPGGRHRCSPAPSPRARCCALGDEAAQARLLPGIASGELIATLAGGGTGTARADGDALTGEISPGSTRRRPACCSCPRRRPRWPVPTARPRCCSRSTPRRRACEVTPLPALDHSRSLARVRLDGAAGRRLDGDAAAALGFARDLANLALASEQVGAMAACLR